MFSALTDVTPLDVVACYTEEEREKLWLFFVEQVEGDTVKGPWFQENAERNYILENRSEISANNIIQIGTDANMLYVLPKHFPINEYYSPAPAIEKMLLREIGSVG